MRQFEGQTWEEELEEKMQRLVDEGERAAERAAALGAERGEANALRNMLRIQLQQRFPTVSAEMLQRLETATLEQLRAAVAKVFVINSPDELQF